MILHARFNTNGMQNSSSKDWKIGSTNMGLNWQKKRQGLSSLENLRRKTGKKGMRKLETFDFLGVIYHKPENILEIYM